MELYRNITWPNLTVVGRILPWNKCTSVQTTHLTRGLLALSLLFSLISVAMAGLQHVCYPLPRPHPDTSGFSVSTTWLCTCLYTWVLSFHFDLESSSFPISSLWNTCLWSLWWAALPLLWAAKMKYSPWSWRPRLACATSSLLVCFVFIPLPFHFSKSESFLKRKAVVHSSLYS